MSDDLRFLISTGISILELLEDRISDEKNHLFILDLIEALRLQRMKIDSAKLRGSHYAAENATLKKLAEQLTTLEKNMQKEIDETEMRLQYAGHIARLIKKLY